MVFKDVTPIMVLGETRHIAPGKILVRVSVSRGLPLSSVADLALVALGADGKAIGPAHVVCRTYPFSPDRSMRLLVDVIESDFGSSPLWYGCIFEIATSRLPKTVGVVALVGDSSESLSPDMTVTVEDGLSDPHVFPCRFAPGDRSAILTTVYRHQASWKLRAVGLAFKADRTAIAAELGMKEAWPRASADQSSQPSTRADTSPLAAHPAPPSAEMNPSRPVATTAPTPESSEEPAPPPLDLARQSALERDTAAVSALLSEIFTDRAAPPPKIEARNATPSLNPQHVAVLRALMAAGSMSPPAFEKTVRDAGLERSAAMETITDWSFDLVGDYAVIDDGETFTFNEDVRRSVENLI